MLTSTPDLDLVVTQALSPRARRFAAEFVGRRGRGLGDAASAVGGGAGAAAGGFFGGILSAVGGIATAIPGIADAFGANKGAAAQRALETKQAEVQLKADELQAQVNATSSQRSLETLKTVAPWIGGGLGVLGLALAASYLWPRRAPEKVSA